MTARLDHDRALTDASFDRYTPGLGGFFVHLGEGTPSNGGYSASTSVPSTAWAVMETSVSKSNGARQIFYDVNAGSSTPYNLDVAGKLLPWVGTPVLNVDTAQVSVATSGTGTGDVFEARVSYSRTVGQTTTTFRWRVDMAAPGNFALPQLPATVGDVNPKSGDLLVQDTDAVYTDSDALNGYDQARNGAFSMINAFTRGVSTANQAPVPMPTGTSLFRVSTD